MNARAAALLLLLGSGSATIGAQTVRGIVVDGANGPVPGVVVLLVDGPTNVIARALSDTRGEFRLVAPRAGDFRVRTMRIGYQPVTSDLVAVRAGATVSQRIVLTGVRVALDTVRVVDRGTCRTTGDSGMATFAAWEQVRTALAATQLTASARVIVATTVRYTRTLDPTMEHVRAQIANVRSDYVEQPWRSISADSLRRSGYAVSGAGDTTTYYAPGLDVLASNSFIEDHCFHLVSAPDPRTIGIAFEPLPSRRQLAEIRGTLWLDRATSELRQLEFHYVNIPDVQRDQAERAGGDIDFARMQDGGWVISAWDIRMPMLATETNLGRREAHVAAMRVSGGLLAMARHGGDTLWTRQPLVLKGMLVDSASGKGLANARVALRGTQLEATSDADGHFLIPGMLFGNYTADVRTPSLDSVGAVSTLDVQFTDSTSIVRLAVPTAAQVAGAVCADSKLLARDPPVGILAGTVRQVGESAPPPSVLVIAQWKDYSIHGTVNEPLPSAAEHAVGARTDAHGEYRICGLPVATRITVQASVDGAKAAADTLHIWPTTRFARADLTIDAHASPTSTFTGSVLTRSTRVPVAGAEISFPDISRLALTDTAGAFLLADLPAGTHHVVIRRLGFGPLDTTIVFVGNRAVERTVYLDRVTQLDSVVVTAAPIVLPGFDDHRKVGLGQFLTRVDLAKMEDRRLSSVLQQMRGVRILPGTGNLAWLASGRGIKSIDTSSGALHIPNPGEHAEGARIDCYAHVYVDGHLVSGRSPNDPLFDINSIQPDQIESIEYYAGPSETPLEYSELNAVCGVIVIWRRRSP